MIFCHFCQGAAEFRNWLVSAPTWTAPRYAFCSQQCLDNYKRNEAGFPGGAPVP